jgi:dipeptidyl aminopeptidase/acylaminoacyl peptidase
MPIFAGREDDPGSLYFLNNADHTVKFVENYRPGVNHKFLARPLPISFVARDETRIHGYLPLPRGRDHKALPLIIMPHGGPYGVRDTLRYDGEVQLLANRGYAVLQSNFRGSGGYGAAFEELGDGRIGRAMQDDIDDAMDWPVQEGIAGPKRVCVVGSSYGGYASL